MVRQDSTSASLWIRGLPDQVRGAEDRTEDLDARVADVSGNVIAINAGSAAGLKAGQTFTVYHKGKEIKDPSTGEVLDVQTTPIGQLTITSVRDRIATGGGSAGGYLTQMTGFCLEPRPRALVSYFGYGDLIGPWYSEPSEFYRRQPLVSKEEAYAAVGSAAVSDPPQDNQRARFYLYCRQNGLWPKEVTGHDPHTDRKWFDRYCPVRNVTARYPPTILIHGTNDTDVPYSLSQDMDAKLSQAGVEHEFITVQGAGHGLSGAKPEEVAQVADRAVQFVKAHTT